METLVHIMFCMMFIAVIWDKVSTYAEDNVRIVVKNNYLSNNNRGPIYEIWNQNVTKKQEKNVAQNLPFVDSDALLEITTTEADPGTTTPPPNDGRKTLYISLGAVIILIVIVIFSITCYCCFCKKTKKSKKKSYVKKGIKQPIEGYPKQTTVAPMQLDVTELQSNSERGVLALPQSVLSSAGESESEDDNMNNIVVKPEIHSIPNDHQKEITELQEERESVKDDSLNDQLKDSRLDISDSDSRSPSFVLYQKKNDRIDQSLDYGDKDRQLDGMRKGDYGNRNRRRDEYEHYDREEQNRRKNNYDDRYIETGYSSDDRRRDDFSHQNVERGYSNDDKRKYDERNRRADDFARYDRRKDDFDSRDRLRDDYDQREGRIKTTYGPDGRRDNGDYYRPSNNSGRGRDEYGVRRVESDSRYLLKPKGANDTRSSVYRDNYDRGSNNSNERQISPKRIDNTIASITRDNRYKEPYNRDVRHELSSVISLQNEKQKNDHNSLLFESDKEDFTNRSNYKVPDPDYVKPERSHERPTKVLPRVVPTSSKTVIKPRDFKGPYSQDDLDEMNNPYTYGRKNQKRPAIK